MDTTKVPEAVENTALDKEVTQTEVCDICNKEITLGLDEHLTEFDGKKFCQNCLNDETFICEDCGDRAYTDNNVSVRDGDMMICEGCYENDYFTCNCDWVDNADNGRYCDDCSITLCNSCGDDHYHEDCEADGYYRSYSDTPIKGDVKKARRLKYDRLVGIEAEVVDGNPSTLSNELDKRIGITSDGSLNGNYAVELQTPPSSADELEKIIDNMTRALRKSDYSVNTTCGLHIHLDSADIIKSQSKLIKLFNVYYTIEPIIWAMLPKSRRNNIFCKPIGRNITPNDFRKIVVSTRTKDEYYIQKQWYKVGVETIRRYKGQKCGGDRYFGFNGHALYGLGHLELRYHSGTINKRKIMNWVELNLLLHDWAINKYKKISIDVLNGIDNDDLEQKTNLFYRLFDVPQHLRTYISERIAKFRVSTANENSTENDIDVDSVIADEITRQEVPVIPSQL